MRKKRILFVTEANFLSTGYGNYTKELLSRLNRDKYEIFELGCYANPRDPKIVEQIKKTPWYFIVNEPGNDAENAEYNKDPFNQLGKFRFEAACLLAKPDIVADFRDEWYFNYQAMSKFRPNFKIVWSPACDSVPQNESWLNTFTKADALLTYTDWSTKVLEQHDNGNGILKIRGAAVPGVDYGVFSPVIHHEGRHVSKSDFKEIRGLPKDSFIVGTTMRAQDRKLYGELFKAFRLFLDRAPKALAEKTYLYCHTFYPDLRWDVPRLIKEHGITNKVFFTYLCHNCEEVTSTLFNDARTVCRRCKQYSVSMPNTRKGVDRPELAKIYNLLDAYVQYSNSEGFGLPQIEAAACEIPIFATNYSAMEYVVNKLRGYPIKVQGFLTDHENGGTQRAYPDPQDFVSQLIKFLELPENMRIKKGIDSRRLAQQFFQWNSCVAKWEETFDSLPTMPDNIWSSPAKYIEPNQNVPQEIMGDPHKIVRWGILNILQDSSLINTFFELEHIFEIQIGRDTVNNLYQKWYDKVKYDNFWESQRVQQCR